MCCYLRSVVIQDVVIPEGICVAVNGEKFWARNQRRYKRYVVIHDVVISKVYCTSVLRTYHSSTIPSLSYDIYALPKEMPQFPRHYWRLRWQWQLARPGERHSLPAAERWLAVAWLSTELRMR